MAFLQSGLLPLLLLITARRLFLKCKYQFSPLLKNPFINPCNFHIRVQNSSLTPKVVYDKAPTCSNFYYHSPTDFSIGSYQWIYNLLNRYIVPDSPPLKCLFTSCFQHNSYLPLQNSNQSHPTSGISPECFLLPTDLSSCWACLFDSLYPTGLEQWIH